jgi:hypothetical protein
MQRGVGILLIYLKEAVPVRARMGEINQNSPLLE